MGLTEAFVSILVEAWGAALGADSVLEHVSIHAQQAVGAQGAPAGVAAPVALWETDGGGGGWNAQPGWISSAGRSSSEDQHEQRRPSGALLAGSLVPAPGKLG